MSDRFIKNKYPPYEEFIEENAFDRGVFVKRIENGLLSLLKVWEKESERTDRRDTSVYTGTTGLALTYMKLAETYPEKSEEFLATARSYLESKDVRVNPKDITFLCGSWGHIVTTAVLEKKLTGKVNFSEGMCKDFSKGSFIKTKPDELLYGRAGFLFGLLFLQKHIDHKAVNVDIIKEVISSILKSGQREARRRKLDAKLFFQWDGEDYLGAAHGVGGILYLLLEAKEYLSLDELNDLIKPSIDFMMSLSFSGGNYPACLGEADDTLVHWCHGAPGMVHLFALAYKVFKDKKYLKEAEKCCQVVWKRGLLRKGYGLCHGVAGNAYCFLRMYRVTMKDKYLYMAYCFAEFCCDYGSHGCRKADTPYSLFEGMAGTLWFLADILKPKAAAFPCFQLDMCDQ